jgi:hypothetical protein
MKHLTIAALSLGGFLVLAPARADDLTGVDRFICSAGSVSVCCDDGQCASGTADELSVPQFIEVDLGQKRVNTTKASKLNRTSPIDIVKRVNGLIVLQGVENRRAFSISIDEKTGWLSAAVAVEDAGCGVSAFGECTPLSDGK